ncbi:MAG TPA: nitric oxide reductase, partial [Rhodocyclaceae bacterium]|nr:nitric oxide reductase [Rhodocyclaceae bacterium]
MEEWVGGLWDRFITKAASREYPAAAVQLKDMEKTLGMMFRALGGDPGLRVQQAVAERHGARRGFLQRVAGTGQRSAQAGLDGEQLRLPERIALFADSSLNRDLYCWLA